MVFLIKFVIIWMPIFVSMSLVHSTMISSLNLLFETFNPMSMVRFYEFNDKGYNITDSCIQDMFVYLDGLHRDIFWAVKLFDASGYYSGGIYIGNEIRHGNPSLCHEMNSEYYKNYQLNEQLEILNQSITPFPVRMIVVTYKMFVENSPFSVTNIVQSACLPSSCSYLDLTQVMSYTQHIQNIRNGIFVSNGELINVKIVSGSYRIYDDNCFYVLAVLLMLILFLSIAAWIYEKFTNTDVENGSTQLGPHALYTSSPNNSITTQSAIQQLTKLNNCDQPNCLTKLKMDPLAESMTVKNKKIDPR